MSRKKKGYERSFTIGTHYSKKRRTGFKRFRETGKLQQVPTEGYYQYECVMCGKEGAYMRNDGKFYCTHCWLVWNS